METRPNGGGHRKFSEIRRPDTLDRRARVAAIAAAMEEAERLFDVRKARGVTQVELADRLGVSQGSVSELERREDLFLSTLRSYVEGLGGKLRLTAEFADGNIPITGIGRPAERSPLDAGLEATAPYAEKGLTKGRKDPLRRR